MNRALNHILMAALLLAPTAAVAGDFVDTRLSFVFADDDVRKGAGETTPNSPAAHIGATNANTQFYDNFNTKYSGFETLSNLVLYKKTPSYFKGLEVETALAINLLVLGEKSVMLGDNSSYIRLNYNPEGWQPDEGLSLSAFPLSADRFRLGYAYKISWGGSRIFPNGGRPVPGAKLQLKRGPFYAFVGMKTTLILNDKIHEEESYYGAMGGAGVDVTPEFRLEAGGGYFGKGVNPQTDVLGQPVRAMGASAQAVFHMGQPVGTSVDLRLYKNDPEIAQRFFVPEAYPGGFAYTFSVEGSYLAQTLKDPDVFGATKVQPARAAALQARAKLDYVRMHVTGLYRELSYIQFNVPGFPPFLDFPKGTSVVAEKFIAAGADVYLPDWHLTPGFIAGAQLPASFSSNGQFGANNPPAALEGTRTVVVRDENLFAVLPRNTQPALIYSAKTTLRWDLSDYAAMIGELYATVDRNRTTFRDDSAGVSEATFEDPFILGFNAILQARF